MKWEDMSDNYKRIAKRGTVFMIVLLPIIIFAVGQQAISISNLNIEDILTYLLCGAIIGIAQVGELLFIKILKWMKE